MVYGFMYSVPPRSPVEFVLHLTYITYSYRHLYCTPRDALRTALNHTTSRHHILPRKDTYLLPSRCLNNTINNNFTNNILSH